MDIVNLVFVSPCCAVVVLSIFGCKLGLFYKLIVESAVHKRLPIRSRCQSPVVSEREDMEGTVRGASSVLYYMNYFAHLSTLSEAVAVVQVLV